MCDTLVSFPNIPTACVLNEFNIDNFLKIYYIMKINDLLLFFGGGIF